MKCNYFIPTPITAVLCKIDNSIILRWQHQNPESLQSSTQMATVEKESRRCKPPKLTFHQWLCNHLPILFSPSSTPHSRCSPSPLIPYSPLKDVALFQALTLLLLLDAWRLTFLSVNYFLLAHITWKNAHKLCFKFAKILLIAVYTLSTLNWPLFFWYVLIVSQNKKKRNKTGLYAIWNPTFFPLGN